MNDRTHFLFLNVGHFLDHLFMLVFATVAALVLTHEWGLTYADLVPYATPGFIAFGLFALPAGWLADRWSREGMMGVFFIGAGLGAIATAFADTPLEMATGLFVTGIFAAIYHPVGLAMIAKGGNSMGYDIAVNGVWGNMGVGSAALITGFLIDQADWRAAFYVPGVVSLAIGAAYVVLYRERMTQAGSRAAAAGADASARSARGRPAQGRAAAATAAAGSGAARSDADWRALVIRVTAIIFFTTAVASVIFQGTTFSLPKVFEERLGGIAETATLVGWLAFVVFAIASLTQVIVGRLLDRYGPKSVFTALAALQIVFFLLMPGLTDWAAVAVALGFMIGAFGQIPISDFMIGKVAKSELRASIYGARFIVSFSVLAAVLPLISWVHHNWGFDMLFHILAGCAAAILAAVLMLPDRMPEPEATLVAGPVEAPAE